MPNECLSEKICPLPRGAVHYWTGPQPAGEGGVPLVFLHGLTADHRLFRHQTVFFAQSRPVLAWDAPGHGSSRPYAGLDYPDMATALRAVLDAEGISAAVLVGQSMGGFVAQSFAARWPERTAGMVLIGSCPYRPKYYSRADLWWLRHTGLLLRPFPDGALRRTMAAMCCRTPAGRQNMRQMLEGYSRAELCRLMELGFAGFLPELALDPAFACPVWLAAGAQDRTGKVLHYNRRWHQAEGLPLYLLPGAAHNANDDQPARMNRLLQQFLAAHGL